MNVLITGGAGFIGSHLAKRLVGQGNRVHLLDDLSTGRRENVSELLGDGCCLQVARVSEALGNHAWIGQFDQIYHLAAAVGVQLIVDEPEHTIETNVLDTAAILRAATEHRVPILIASSSEVYGKSDRIPFAEDDDVHYGATRFSRWSYAISKAVDEYLALACHQQHGLGVVVVRLFNTIGPGQIGRYGMVVPRFIDAAMANEPLEIYGDGRQTRCFCHVTDVVEALVRLLGAPECHGRVFNVGSEEEVSIEALADRIIELSGSRSVKKFVPYDVAYGAAFDDLRRRVPDLKRVRQAVGFAPSRDLDSILRELIGLARTESPGNSP